ncbi:MAG: Xaa-Pro peptidase family protein [Desulfovibrionaceae bacterium]
MHTSIEIISPQELSARHRAVLAHLRTVAPEATGLLVFSRVDFYYLSASLVNGMLWLPHEGEPVLLARKGIERCRLESPLTHMRLFKSYGEVPALCADCGSPLRGTVAAQMSALPWSLATLLQSRLSECHFVPGDQALMLARAVKSPWELQKMSIAGGRHHQALTQMLPCVLHAGLTEREIAHMSWRIFFELGHSGMNRMGNYGEDVFLGHIAAGENGNYPSHFNGPLGLKGEHPAQPFMGYAGSVWQKHSPLALDIGFVLEGYHTDKTQLYWSGTPDSVPSLVRRAQDACLSIQHRAAAALRVGAIPSDIWHAAQKQAEELGFTEGFMGLMGNKVHFLGHGIGLVIDEFPVLAPRFDAPLQAGMVLAIEPKIGLPGVGMVGVEDTFEVTDEGGKCLTGSPMDIICIGA